MASRRLPEKEDFYERSGGMSNGLSSSSIGEYFNAGGTSMLDISTRLRITEAELTIVKNEVSELVAEKNALEIQCKKHENSWKFALVQLGRTIEERNEALAQLPPRSAPMRESKSPEVKAKKLKAPVLKAELDNCLLQLETQTRVARQVEHERDKANDELEFAKSQISTLMMQHTDLLSTCSEVAAERDKAIAESKLLRAELNKYDKELLSAIESELGEDGQCDTEKEKMLLQQIRLLREEKEQLQRAFHQNVEQYKKQIAKCNMERRQTATSADAMKALLQRRLESALAENSELRSELRASGEMIAQLKEQLAQVRIACHHRNGYDMETPTVAPQEDVTSEVTQGLFQSNSSNYRHGIPPLSQDTGISLYNSKGPDGTGGGSVNPSFSMSSDLITPGNHSNMPGYRVSSARTRKGPYVPTASPFPEESREESTDEEEASWI